MITEAETPTVAPRTTSLYDPISGFIYSYELFEKDLFHASPANAARNGQGKTLVTRSAGTSNRTPHP